MSLSQDLTVFSGKKYAAASLNINPVLAYFLPEPTAMKGKDIVIEPGTDPDAGMALLFGWAGCRDRYLAKYSEMYKDAGLTVVRYTPDVAKIRSYKTYKDLAFEIYDQVLRESDTPTILCHVFSMNGCSVFSGLWDALGSVEHGDVIKKKIKGVIFDSCPAFTGAWRMAVAMSLALFPPSKYGSVLRGLYQVSCAGIVGLYNARVWLQSCWCDDAWENNYAYYHMLTMRDLPKNQLYIYSKADTICLPEYIENFIDKQQTPNPATRIVAFEDSNHCEHMRVHRDEYQNSCLEFLQFIL